MTHAAPPLKHDVSREEGREFIRRAVESANSNALRICLYQLTGDAELEAMRPVRKLVRGGALLQNVVQDEDLPRLWDKAAQFLSQYDASAAPPPPPASSQTRRLLKLFSAQPLSENYIAMGVEELACDEFPRDVAWSKPPSSAALQDVGILIIGAGISGIAAAVQFSRLGIPYEIVERQGDVGGTWQLNDYPSARVDTSSFLYQFKFEKHYPWKSLFATRDESKAYLAHVVDKYDIRSRITFDTEVTDASWDDAAKRWFVSCRDRKGRITQRSAPFLVSASGLFSTPNIPDIPGRDDFEGKKFHTAHWDHAYDFAGKRIALIGTGSSGTQVMPALAKGAESLTVYQRTPNWIARMENYYSEVPPEMQWLLDTLPYYWNWFCYSSFDVALQLQNSQSYDHEWRKTGAGINQTNENLKRSLTGFIHEKLAARPDLIEKCLPDYPPLARRLVVDNGFYDALLQDNVELVTSGIERITAKGIMSADGVENEFDLIVFGAGFKVTQYLWPVAYRGRGGLTLEDAWRKDGARSYLGSAMPGFPNFFMFYGPNGQPRSGGFYSWAEMWARYTADVIIKTLEGGWRTVEVKNEVFETYNVKLDIAMKEIIWEVEGAGGYYNNAFGRCGTNLPFLTEDYHAMIKSADMDDFILST